MPSKDGQFPNNQVASASVRDSHPVITDQNKELFIGFIADIRIKQNGIHSNGTAGHLDSQ